MRKRTHARELVLQFLYQQEMNPDALESALTAFWEEHADSGLEIRTYTERVIKGTLEHLPELDELITRYADNWKLNRMAAIDRNILRYATFEILYLEDIPPKVAINEAVNIAKKFSQPDSGKFVNGVLDKINHSETHKYPTPIPKADAGE